MALDVTDRMSAQAGQWDAWLGCTHMAEAVRTYDWSGTALGSLSTWPQSLRSALGLCLHSQFPMAIYWGPELNYICNDAEWEVLRRLHPWALGLPAREVLRDAWESVGPHLEAALERSESTWVENQAVVVERHGRPEESFFTCSYCPIPDEDGSVGGVLVLSKDTTAQVLAERRADSLRELITLRDAGGRSDAAVANGRVVERARHEGELRAVLNDLRAAQRRVAMAADAERRRIERDLHDGAQQRLMALRLELGLFEERLTDDPGEAVRRLRDLRRELDEALEELRELAHGLYPPLLVSDGLEAALTAAARRSPIPVMVDARGMTRAPRSIESTAYFCCLEALQNATKHGGPGAHATLELRMSDGLLTFRVYDDGAGFDPTAVRPGHGLINLRDRLQALGGEASVISSPGAGTTVIGQIPMP